MSGTTAIFVCIRERIGTHNGASRFPNYKIRWLNALAALIYLSTAAEYRLGLAQRMSTLGAIITEAIVHHYGRDAFLERLSHPFWFQSFGAVMGMDWHSSGITTSVIGALKRGLGRKTERTGNLRLRWTRQSVAQNTG